MQTSFWRYATSSIESKVKCRQKLDREYAAQRRYFETKVSKEKREIMIGVARLKAKRCAKVAQAIAFKASRSAKKNARRAKKCIKEAKAVLKAYRLKEQRCKEELLESIRERQSNVRLQIRLQPFVAMKNEGLTSENIRREMENSGAFTEKQINEFFMSPVVEEVRVDDHTKDTGRGKRIQIHAQNKNLEERTVEENDSISAEEVEEVVKPRVGFEIKSCVENTDEVIEVYEAIKTTAKDRDDDIDEEIYETVESPPEEVEDDLSESWKRKQFTLNVDISILEEELYKIRTLGKKRKLTERERQHEKKLESDISIKKEGLKQLKVEEEEEELNIKSKNIEGKLEYRAEKWKAAALYSNHREQLLEKIKDAWLDQVEVNEEDGLPPPPLPSLLNPRKQANIDPNTIVDVLDRLKDAWREAESSAKCRGRTMPPKPKILAEQHKVVNKKSMRKARKRKEKMKRNVGSPSTRKSKIDKIKFRIKEVEALLKCRKCHAVTCFKNPSRKDILLWRKMGCKGKRPKGYWSRFCSEHQCSLDGCDRESTPESGNQYCTKHARKLVDKVLKTALVKGKSRLEKQMERRESAAFQLRMQERERIRKSKVHARLVAMGIKMPNLQVDMTTPLQIVKKETVNEEKKKRTKKMSASKKKVKTVKKKGISRRKRKRRKKTVKTGSSVSIEKKVKLVKIQTWIRMLLAMRLLPRKATYNAAKVAQLAAIDAQSFALVAATVEIDHVIRQRILSRVSTSHLQDAISSAFAISSSEPSDESSDESDSGIDNISGKENIDETEEEESEEELIELDGEIISVKKMKQEDNETQEEYAARMEREYQIALEATRKRKLAIRQYKPAKKLQTCARGWLARTKYRGMKKERECILKIQSCFRACLARRRWRLLLSPVYMDVLTSEGLIDVAVGRLRVQVHSLHVLGEQKMASVTVMKTTKAKECGLVGVKDDVPVQNLYGALQSDLPVPWDSLSLRPSSMVNDEVARKKAISIMQKMLAQVHACLSSLRADARVAWDVDEVQESADLSFAAMRRLKTARDVVLPPLPPGEKPTTPSLELRKARRVHRLASEKLEKSIANVVSALKEKLVTKGHLGVAVLGPRRRAALARMEVAETELVEATAAVADLGNWREVKDEIGQKYFVNRFSGESVWSRPRTTATKNLIRNVFSGTK
eukprot:g2907.t1